MKTTYPLEYSALYFFLQPYLAVYTPAAYAGKPIRQQAKAPKLNNYCTQESKETKQRSCAACNSPAAAKQCTQAHGCIITDQAQQSISAVCTRRTAEPAFNVKSKMSLQLFLNNAGGSRQLYQCACVLAAATHRQCNQRQMMLRRTVSATSGTRLHHGL